MIAVDDVQWGDLDSVALLVEMVRPPSAPPLLVIASYRAEEAATSPVLRALLTALRGELAASVRVHEIDVGAPRPPTPSGSRALRSRARTVERAARIAAERSTARSSSTSWRA